MVDLATIHTKKNHLETLAHSDPEIMEFCGSLENPWRMAHLFGWIGILFCVVGGTLLYYKIDGVILMIGIALEVLSLAYKTSILNSIEKKYDEVISGGAPPDLRLSGKKPDLPLASDVDSIH